MSAQKSILVFHHAPHLGGATISGGLVLKAISNNNNIVAVYCNTRISEAARYYHEKGFEVLQGGKSPVSFLHYSGDHHFALSPRLILNYFRILRDRKNIDKIIRKFEPDVVVVNSMTLFWIGKICKKHKIETICFVRETFVNGLFGLRTFLIKRSLNRYFDKVAFISQYDHDRATDLSSRKYVIYNAIDDQCRVSSRRAGEWVKRSSTANDTKFVLYLGGFHKLKGAHVLIRAIRELDRDDVQFIFLGVGGTKKKSIRDCSTWVEKIRFLTNLDYEKKCLNMISSLKIADKINVYPAQSDLSSYFDSCDMLVFPMTQPHQARPIIEAGYFDLPVIVADFPNIREFVDKKSGFLFPSGDHRKLADKINYVLNNPKVAANRARLNHIRVSERHSFKNVVKNITDIFEA